MLSSCPEPRWILALTALALGACATAPSPIHGGLTLPQLPGPISADGRSAADAWAGATVIQQGELTLRLGHVADGIALRIETSRPSIATLGVAAGDRVWLLHASAALGTGQYRCSSDGRCSRVRNFEWSCRDPSDRPDAVACRDAFRTKEGWVANVHPEAGRVREFFILPPRFLGDARAMDGLRVVVTVLTLPDRAETWPPVTDATAWLAVQQGALPDAARFDVATWLEVPGSAPPGPR